MDAPIKYTQLTRVGYNYQDLICVQLLIDWYHDHYKYQWVKIETDTVDGIKVNSLDDVVALRADNLYELTQVKFTIDSSRKGLALDFKWLTDHKKNGTSLLQKWAKDVLSYGHSNTLALANLKTNRIPDAILKACLVDKKVNIKNIPIDILSTIDRQLEGRSNTEYFFSNFTFNHSLQKIDDLENQLHDSLVPDHTNEEGWLTFLKSVMRWATRKGVLSNDGCIYFDDIHQILSASVSREISQYFEIPERYSPPSRDFHKGLLCKIEEGAAWVVSGAPGMGKSTYLSYLYESLRSNNKQVIRHHYSLNSQSIIDRISYTSAAGSLIKQIKDIYGTRIIGIEDKPENLDQWLAKAGSEAKNNNSIIVVIIDGLDHVWRERPNISQLDHLINRILPLPEGVSLILGTQPVSDTKLPSRLSIYCPLNGSQWLTLPHMDLSAVSSWVDGLRNAGIIELQNYGAGSNDSIVEVSEALLKVSHGYPLHLIYSLRSLLKKQKLIRPYEIEKLPACPDGDIHAYYSEIWSALSPLAKEILYMMAITDFPWPDKNSLGCCFDKSENFLTAYNDIEHLVECRRSGIFPFHGSIIVNIRKKESYLAAKKRLMPIVKLWLDEKAPSFWKWGWGWIVSTELGDCQPLLNGITRLWVRTALCNGYPIQHVEHIISFAEKTAFNEKNYSKLVDLRLIKIRLVNGPDFQVQDFPEFIKCAIVSSDDDYGLLWRSDNIRLLESNEIVALSSMYRATDETVIEECYQELYRRILFYANIEQDRENKLDALINALLQLLCDREQPDIERILEFIERTTPNEALYKKLFTYLISSDNSSYIFDIERNILPEKVVSDHSHAMVIASCISEIKLSGYDEYSQIQDDSLGACYVILHDEIDIKDGSKKIAPCSSKSDFIDLYFQILSASLSLKEVTIDDGSVHKYSDADLYAYHASQAIYDSAVKTANKIANDEKIGVLDIYTHLTESGFIRDIGYDHTRHEILQSILWGLPKIAINLYLLINSSKRPQALDNSSFMKARQSSWWNAVLFFRYIGDISANIVEKDILEKQLNECFEEVSKSKNNTAELCNDALDITAICRTLGLTDSVKTGLDLTAKYLLGYGYRKDVTFHEVFEAIQACSDAEVGDMPNWLGRVSQFTVDMYDFTEREINHLPGWYTKLVAKHCPERLYDELAFHLENQHWYVLDDILTSYVKYADLNEPANKSLIKCFVSYDTIEELKVRSEENSDIKQLFQNQIAFVGGYPPVPREHHSSSTLEDKHISIGYKTYTPDQLNSLITRVKEESVYTDYEYFVNWIDFWDKQGLGVDVINAFDSLFKTGEEFPYDTGLMYSLDEVFKLSKKLQGKKRAYIWAVRSIRVNSYWSRYSGRRASKMISYYGSVYADRWESLLSESTHGELLKLRGDEWIIVPTSELVKYLLSAGQKILAIEVTEVLVQSLEYEIQHLAIEPSYWSDNISDSNHLGFKMLLTYYQWPDRIVRIRCAKEIAILLESDSKGELQPLYIDHLRGIANEQGVADFVSILSFMDTIPFDKNELVAAIPYHSLALQNIFEIIDIDYDKKLIKNTHLPGSSDYCAGDRLKKAMNGIPHIYTLWLETLGSKLSCDLVSHMAAELDHIYDRNKFRFFDPFSFVSDYLYRSESIMCSFSSVTECAVLSAYLRTVAFAASKYSIPDSEIKFLVSQTLSFEHFISYLQPAEIPINWPALPNHSLKNKAPTKRSLQRVLDKLGSNKEIVLGASGPVMRKVSGVCIDLEVYAVSVTNSSDLSDEEIFEAAKKEAGNSLNSVSPLSSKSFPHISGRWEVDKVARGLFEPLFKVNLFEGGNKNIIDNKLRFCEGDAVNSQWQYWHQHWYPARYSELGADLGAILTASEETTSILVSGSIDELYLVGEFTILDKRDYSAESKLNKMYLKSRITPNVYNDSKVTAHQIEQTD